MTLAHFNLVGSWLVDGGGEAEVLRSSRITAGVGGHATAQIKGINKRLVGAGQRVMVAPGKNGGCRWSIVRVDHLNGATLFAVAPHCTLSM